MFEALIGSAISIATGFIPDKGAEAAQEAQQDALFWQIINDQEASERNAELAKYGIIAFGVIAALLIMYLIFRKK